MSLNLSYATFFLGRMRTLCSLLVTSADAFIGSHNDTFNDESPVLPPLVEANIILLCSDLWRS